MRTGTQLVNGGLRVRREGGIFFFLNMRDSFTFSLKPSVFYANERDKNA